MLQHFIAVCSFMIIIILKYNKVIGAEEESPSKKAEAKESKWGEKKFLVVVEFEDDYRCLGAMVSGTTLVTSKICLDYYRFSSKVSGKPCKVLAGTKETVGKDLGIWRYCLRADESLWDDNLDYTKRGIREIEFDLPFADMETADVGKPTFADGSDCFVYGFSSGKADPETSTVTEGANPEPPPEPQAKFKREIPEENITEENITEENITEDQDPQFDSDEYGKSTEQSEDISHDSPTTTDEDTAEFEINETQEKKKGTKRPPILFLNKREGPSKSDGKEDTSFKVIKANILNLDDCKTMYRDNMDTDLPKDQFCVSEGGINDQGRLLICDDVIVGIVADDLAIKKKNENIVYAYKVANAIQLILNTKVLWSLFIVHFFYTIFLSLFTENVHF